MNGLSAAIWAEALKARRSRVPAFTAAAFALGPLASGLFMAVFKDPSRARRLGILATKASLFTTQADWLAHLALLAQAISVGGALVFAVVAAWVFGREAADGTDRTLLALPTSREAIVVAKLLVAGGWCGALVTEAVVLGLFAGALVGLPGASDGACASGVWTCLVCGALTMALTAPVAFVASAGRGYLAPIGFALLTLVLAQLVAALGWGGVFPWSVPALLAGAAGADAELPGWIGLASVVVTAAAGGLATLGWWRWADHAA